MGARVTIAIYCFHFCLMAPFRSIPRLNSGFVWVVGTVFDARQCLAPSYSLARVCFCITVCVCSGTSESSCARQQATTVLRITDKVPVSPALVKQVVHELEL